MFIQFPGSQDFRFLGALANEKQSAIFKVHNVPSGMLGGGVAADRDAMIDEGATPAATAQGHITLGISIEPVASIQAQLATLQQERNVGSGSSAIVKAPLSTKVLAQRIAKNAINFLTSFSSDPAFLKAFQQWYDKFTRKVEVDPGFLERDE